MSLKFIKLFEEHKKEQESETFASNPTWSQVRDTIQTKRPFMIVDFRTKNSYLEALESEFKEQDYIKQALIKSIDGKTIKYPSLFVNMDRADANIANHVKALYEKFDIKQIVVGEANSEYSTLYSQDGTSSDFGNEIISTLSSDEFGTEDHYQLGSVFYRFIEFEG